MSEETPTKTERTYTIGDMNYRLEDLSWRQTKWLGEHIFKSTDLHLLTYAAVHNILRDDGPLLMAICLIREDQSREDHSKLPFQAIRARADEFEWRLTGAEVGLFGPHFFQFCRPGQLALLLRGEILERLLREAEELSPVPGESGSSVVSSRSAAATLHDSASSSTSGAQLIQIPTSGGASSGIPLTAPSLAGSACSSPG